MNTCEVGAVVEVKPGTPHPENTSMDLAGWRGRVRDRTETGDGRVLLTIALDAPTLEQLPEPYIISSEREGLSWSELRLEGEDVRPAEPRDTKQRARETKRRIWNDYRWYGIGEQGERIMDVLQGVERGDGRACLRRWKHHLEDCFEYPVESRICDDIRISSGVRGDEVSILGISSLDDALGLIVEIQSPNRYTEIPLINLCVDSSSDVHEPLRDYKAWHTHR